MATLLSLVVINMDLDLSSKSLKRQTATKRILSLQRLNRTLCS